MTVNFAVDRYTRCEVKVRDDRKIILRSRDQQSEESFNTYGDLCEEKKYRLPLLAWVLRSFRPESGVEISTDSEAPAGAGISGSSALIIAITSALNKLNKTGFKIEKLREISQNIEAQIIRVPTGCQDYYPAMYGGVNALALTTMGILRRPVPVDLADFNERIVLAYTGVPRNSGINNWEVTKAHINGDRAVERNFSRIAQIASSLHQALERADWTEVARLLREEWQFRRRNAPGISTPLIDNLIVKTRKAGAVGAKVCGAGGGGCVFFLVERGASAKVMRVIEETGAQVLPVTVAPKGVQVKVIPGA